MKNGLGQQHLVSEESSKVVATVYNQMGGGFDDLVESTPFLINCTRLYNFCLEMFSPSLSSSHVLDVGCGSGVQSFALAPFAKQITGVDLSETLIEIAKKRCGNYPHVQFQVGNACALPFPDAHFDFIISYGDVVSHIVEGYEQAISEMARVAKSGALVTFEVDTKWNFGIFYHPAELMEALAVRGKGHATRDWEGMKFKTFTYCEIAAILEKNNLEIVSCRGHNILASLIPDRFLLEKNRRSFLGRVALFLGQIDLAISGLFPFNRFGFNFILTAKKGGNVPPSDLRSGGSL
ncbi:MAG: class I SAM-dependent methyltransferase [Nitrospirota bacterium]